MGRWIKGKETMLISSSPGAAAWWRRNVFVFVLIRSYLKRRSSRLSRLVIVTLVWRC